MDNIHQISLIYTTIGSKKDAEHLASQAVEQNFAACVNILSKGVSVYKWEGKIETSEEYYLLFKTAKLKAQKLIEWLQENHPYDCPAIIELNAECSDDFFNFITNNTSE